MSNGLGQFNIEAIKRENYSMILVDFETFHLFREDAYREYCYSVDAYGSYQPASFIYLCFEGFRELCLRRGVWLIPPPTTGNKQGFPFRAEREPQPTGSARHGLILRINGPNSVETALSAIRAGKNVIALLPNEELGLFYGGNQDRIQASKAAVAALAGNELSQMVEDTICNRKIVWWRELEHQEPGRLFVTLDAFLSDGYFLDGYGKLQENDLQIEGLVSAFSNFKRPLLGLDVPNGIACWPNREPFQFVTTLINHGPALSDVRIVFENPPELELAGAPDRFFPVIEQHSKHKLVVRVVTKREGLLINPLSVKAALIKSGSKEMLEVAVRDHSLLVAPPVGLFSDSGSYEDSAGFTKLLATIQGTGLEPDFAIIPVLARVDIPSCLNKFRVVAESMIIRALEHLGTKLEGANLNSYIDTLNATSMLSKRATGYLHVVRTLGNLGSHYNKEKLTDADLRALSYALASVAEELIEKKLL